MAIDEVTLRGRAFAEATYGDVFAAFSPGQPDVVDGYDVPSWTFRGPVRGKSQAGAQRGSDSVRRTVTVGGTELVVHEAGLHLPVMAFIDSQTGRLLLEAGWQFQCVRIGRATDPAQLGRRWHVAEVPTKSYATARRLDVAEVAPLELDPSLDLSLD